MLRDLTIQLDHTTKQITRCAANKGQFQETAKALGVTVAPLIAGYGMQWNIKYESHRRAILAQEVIDQMMRDDQQDPSSTYGDIPFSPCDWQEIEELNAELAVFVQLTSEMEGNHSSGAHVIPKYLERKEELEEKIGTVCARNGIYGQYHPL
ncbi:hypothetical protein MJO28_009390 [Puccinia striiformis f. sp. tritici]|uniref:Uncharacterized protein n=1 Tax=Puccinia striiformis f. sp. tritici TaxID=168172 RepID=A0ACC0E8D7_9BASI|nr:hypothetical protein MJO28_009390 [Puccinia striiformis f. sp. tritici]